MVPPLNDSLAHLNHGIGRDSSRRHRWVSLVNRFLNRAWILTLFGAANSRLGILSTVFLTYPGSEEYASYFLPPDKVHAARWTPIIVGLYRQRSLWGLSMAVANTESEFRDPANRGQIRRLVEKMEDVRTRTGARHVSYAGVLPGVLFRLRLRQEAIETVATCRLLAAAIANVRRAMNYPDDVSIVLLGGAGFLGRRLRAYLRADGVYVVDLGLRWRKGLPFESHSGRPAIVVNLASCAALEQQASTMAPGLVVINEAYPEPSLARIIHER